MNSFFYRKKEDRNQLISESDNKKLLSACTGQALEPITAPTVELLIDETLKALESVDGSSKAISIGRIYPVGNNNIG